MKLCVLIALVAVALDHAASTSVKFSIFAAKPAKYATLSRHYHEFRHVHAIQTVDAALHGGIISYTQGYSPFISRTMEDELAASANGSSLQAVLPAPLFDVAKPSLPTMVLLARLEFDSVQAINGTFKSPVYQATSGAHTFADPQVVYLTEELESLADQAKALGVDQQSTQARVGLARARLVVALAPADDDDETFKQKWDAHATRVHAMIAAFANETEELPLKYLPLVEYQRHKSLQFSLSEVDAILDGSPFRNATFRMGSGGYEDVAFLHSGVLASFLSKYGSELRASYETFTNVTNDSTSNEMDSTFAMVVDEAVMINPDAWKGVVEANLQL